jgi:hypothetical protein
VTNRAETLQAAYNSSEQELVELRTATLEACQAVEEGEAQAGSSLASRLRALGGHVSRRMHRALHLGVQKALGVVRSHYEVNFEAVASGYAVPEGVEDEAGRRWCSRGAHRAVHGVPVPGHCRRRRASRLKIAGH